MGSGTGKGTTVAKLQSRLGPGKTKTWSNGDVFRSLTLLAATWREKNYNPAWDKALTPTRVAEFMSMLEFGKFEGSWDIKVKGLGVDALVSKVKNTTMSDRAVLGQRRAAQRLAAAVLKDVG